MITMFQGCWRASFTFIVAGLKLSTVLNHRQYDALYTSRLPVPVDRFGFRLFFRFFFGENAQPFRPIVEMRCLGLFGD